MIHSIYYIYIYIYIIYIRIYVYVRTYIIYIYYTQEYNIIKREGECPTPV